MGDVTTPFTANYRMCGCRLRRSEHLVRLGAENRSL